MLPTQVTQPVLELSDLAPSRLPGVEVVALPVLPDDDGTELGPGAAELLEDLDLDLSGVLDQSSATGAPGEVTAIPIGGADHPTHIRLVLLVGVGDGSPADLRRAGAALARRSLDLDAVATSVPSVGDDSGLRAFVEGVVLASFGFSMRSTGPEHRPVRRVVLAGGGVAPGVLAQAVATAGAGWRSRLLATVPSNLKNPQWFADQATVVAHSSGLEITVLDDEQLAARGFGGIVAVGQASATPPRLVQLAYRPPGARRATPHVVLVGKGITFDSGGLSIKPGEAMVNMKRDVTGGAVVLAAMAALGDLGCSVRVTGLVPLAENAISGNALRPGDVITHYGGRTTEVTNTDAEGRLVLADALAYAADTLDPDVLVDVATLTGAIKVALGQRIGGLFATDDALAQMLDRAGAAAGEPLWRMPFVEEYADWLASKVADADNGPKHAQAITAAMFLRPFAGDVPWAHLDLASVGDAPADAHEWTAGPTGFGARTLLYWLEQGQPLAGVRRS